MIISPTIAAEILGEIPPDTITAIVDPELDFENSKGTFWINLCNLDEMTAREYLAILGDVSAWMDDPEAINWMDTEIEITEISYAESVAMWEDTARLNGPTITHFGIEASWKSNGMCFQEIPAIKLEVI